MGLNHTMGKRRQWAKIPSEKRSQMMSERAKKMWAKKTPEQRLAISKKMIEAREKLKLSIGIP